MHLKYQLEESTRDSWRIRLSSHLRVYDWEEAPNWRGCKWLYYRVRTRFSLAESFSLSHSRDCAFQSRQIKLRAETWTWAFALFTFTHDN